MWNSAILTHIFEYPCEFEWICENALIRKSVSKWGLIDEKKTKKKQG
jgi:hypothetical protein